MTTKHFGRITVYSRNTVRFLHEQIIIKIFHMVWKQIAWMHIKPIFKLYVLILYEKIKFKIAYFSNQLIYM